MRCQVLVDDVMIVFLAGAAEGFEQDDKKDYTDAGSGEHAFGSNVP